MSANKESESRVAPTGRRHLQAPEVYQQWEYLQGVGPSSSQMYHAEETKPFRAGWDKTKRPQAAIRQDEERIAADTSKDERYSTIKQMRGERRTECMNTSKFNPITGDTLDEFTRTWQPSANPWQHQTQGLKPAATIRSQQQQQLNSQEPPAGSLRGGMRAESQAMVDVVDMRRARLANDGLTHSKRVGGTARDCLVWQ